jgi:hypothetical protein
MKSGGCRTFRSKSGQTNDVCAWMGQ